MTVLMRTQGTRPATLQEALLSLAAQTVQDFEVLLLAHNVPRESSPIFDIWPMSLERTSEVGSP